MNSAKSELQRMMSQLQSFIHTAEADEETKEKKRSSLISEKADIFKYMEKQNDHFLRATIISRNRRVGLLY